MTRHFHRLDTGFHVSDAASEIAATPPPLWVPFQQRPDFELLVARGYPRGRIDPAPNGLRVTTLLVGGVRTADCANWPAVTHLLDQVLARLGNPLALGASIRMMPPQSRIAPHTDNFAARKTTRLHLAIQCDAQAVFTINGERCRFEPGDLWLVDIRGHTHSVNNRSERPRAMLMIDVTLSPTEVRAIFAQRVRAEKNNDTRTEAA